jgi:hypothetical protein
MDADREMNVLINRATAIIGLSVKGGRASRGAFPGSSWEGGEKMQNLFREVKANAAT